MLIQRLLRKLESEIYKTGLLIFILLSIKILLRKFKHKLLILLENGDFRNLLIRLKVIMSTVRRQKISRQLLMSPSEVVIVEQVEIQQQEMLRTKLCVRLQMVLLEKLIKLLIFQATLEKEKVRHLQ